MRRSIGACFSHKEGGNMKIAIDGRAAILYCGTGIGTYAWQLLEHMQRIDPNIRVLWPGEEYHDFRINAPGALDIVEQGGDYWQRCFLPEILREENIDLYHVPQNGIGLPQDKPCKLLVTIHDLIPYIFPETVGKGYLREFIQAMPEIMEKSDGIVTVSQCSKRDIMRIFAYPCDKIDVVYEAPEPLYRPMEKRLAAAYLKEQYGIDAPYLVYVGGFSMRKNVKALINAYALLKKEEDFPYLLVLPGKRHREFDQLDSLIEALGVEEGVCFPGYIPAQDLPYFYGGAELMVYPSFYEGFGLPPLEAMAMGVPVLAANTSSLPEVLGDAAAYFNPYISHSLAERIAFLMDHPDIRNNMGTKSLIKAKEYSWERTAKQTYEIYHRHAEDK